MTWKCSRYTRKQFLSKFSELSWQPELQWVGSWILLSAFTLLIQSCASAIHGPKEGKSKKGRAVQQGRDPHHPPPPFMGSNFYSLGCHPDCHQQQCSFLNETSILLDYFTDKYCTRLLSAWIHHHPCGQISFCIYTKAGIFLKRYSTVIKQTDSKNKYMLNKVVLFCVFCQDHTSPFWPQYQYWQQPHTHTTFTLTSSSNNKNPSNPQTSHHKKKKKKPFSCANLKITFWTQSWTARA